MIYDIIIYLILDIKTSLSKRKLFRVHSPMMITIDIIIANKLIIIVKEFGKSDSLDQKSSLHDERYMCKYSVIRII